jgi:hypothetical protein
MVSMGNKSGENDETFSSSPTKRKFAIPMIIMHPRKN